MKLSRVIIIEDEAIIALDIQHRLERMGHTVLASFRNGQDALAEMGQYLDRTDLILMDVMLDGPLDGIETATQILRMADIPVIYLTALADDETIQRTKLPNTAGYIHKPFTDQDLHIAIEMGLYRHQLSRKMRPDHYTAPETDSTGASERAGSAPGRQGHQQGQQSFQQGLQSHQHGQTCQDRKIALWAGDELFLVKPEDIDYLEINSGIVDIRTRSRSFQVRGTLREWEDKLAGCGFYRSHKSFLVNLERITKLSPCIDNSYMIWLNGRSEQIPLARQKVAGFLESFAD